jgi:hypothetical protein
MSFDFLEFLGCLIDFFGEDVVRVASSIIFHYHSNHTSIAILNLKSSLSKIQRPFLIIPRPKIKQKNMKKPPIASSRFFDFLFPSTNKTKASKKNILKHWNILLL